MVPDTMKVPVPPPRMAWGPTLLSAMIPIGWPWAPLPTEPDAKHWSLWIPKIPAKKGVHFGVAFTLTPHAPGGGLRGPVLDVKVPMGWPAELRNWAFQAVP